MEFIEKVSHFFQIESLAFYLAAVIQNLIVLKFMVVLQDDEKDIGCKLCFRNQVSFVFVLSEIFIDPGIRLEEGIKDDHFWSDFKRSESLVQYPEAFEELGEIFEDISPFDIFYLIKSNQFLRDSQCKCHVSLIQGLNLNPLIGDNMCAILTSPLVELDLFLDPMVRDVDGSGDVAHVGLADEGG